MSTYYMLLKYPNTDEEYTIRSIANVIKHRIKNTEFTYKQIAEQIYLHNFPNTNLICNICNGRKTYITFSKGFECRNKKCALSRTVSAMHAHRGSDIENYVHFIKNNIEYYRNNWYKKNVIDPYTNRSTGNRTLLGFISDRLLSGKQLLFYKATCPHCLNEYDEHYIKPLKGYCGERSCRNLRRYYSLDDLLIVDKLVNEFLLGVSANNFSKVKLFDFIKTFDFKNIDKKLFQDKLYKTDSFDLCVTENAKILYRYKDKLNLVQYVEYTDICFLSSAKSKKPHFNEYFNLDTNNIKPSYFDNPKYFFSLCYMQ